MNRFNPRKLILIFLIIVFIFSVLIYIVDWINYPIENKFFNESINDFYSKIYLLLIVFALYKTNGFTYFLCIILLPLHVIYMNSGILYCCTTPFDYSFSISAQIKAYSENQSVFNAIANLINVLPIYCNLLIFIILLLPNTRKDYFSGKKAANSDQEPNQDYLKKQY